MIDRTNVWRGVVAAFLCAGIAAQSRGPVSSAAAWEPGSVEPVGAAECEGGPGGNFDWIVRSGEVFFFDTTATAIVGGPGGVPTTVQNTVGGFVEVRDLIVEDGGRIRVQGPNPFRICASRDIVVRGTIDVGGFDAKDVATLNTGNQPETGPAGGPGGGRGGSSSEVTNGSTPQGGTGFGPHGAVGKGGEGGESGYAAPGLGKDARRPGGGGGGRFAKMRSGLVAGRGRDGHPLSTGAVRGLQPAGGGSAGASPFVDDDPRNDFAGVQALTDPNGQFVGLLRGELPGLWGGYGGGGGGDAVPSASFPNAPWNPGSDEKGGPGGSGGGGMAARAERIVFGANGVITSGGGRGATGENTLFLDHVGGTGGSGSGGHVILRARQIDFTDGDPSTAPLGDRIRAIGGPRVRGSLAFGAPMGISHGGPGGPGVLQLHVPFAGLPPAPSLSSAIVIPQAAASLPEPLTGVASPEPYVLLPGVGGRHGPSVWVPLGGAGASPEVAVGPLTFLFEQEGGEGAPLLGPAALAGSGVTIEPGGRTLAIGGRALEPLRAGTAGDAAYLRTPQLLRHFVLRLSGGGAERDFGVASATYDERAHVLRLGVSGGPGALTAFAARAGGPLDYALVPRFARANAGHAGAPLDADGVRVLFQGTGADPSGRPDEERILVDWTSDLSRFRALAPGLLRFVRFRVEAEAQAGAPAGLGLRVPRRF